MRILAVFGLFSLMLNAFAGNVEHTQSWGDLSIDNTISENTKSKAATPFLVQGTKVSFPEDLTFDSPEAEIISDGIDENSALKIMSARGYGLNSRVKRPQEGKRKKRDWGAFDRQIAKDRESWRQQVKLRGDNPRDREERGRDREGRGQGRDERGRIKPSGRHRF